MSDFFNQLWFDLEVAWSKLQYLVGGHLWLVLAGVAALLLLWGFLSGGVTRKR